MKILFKICNIHLSLLSLLFWHLSATVAIADLPSHSEFLGADEIPILTPTTPAAKTKVAEGLEAIEQGQLPAAIQAFREAIALDRLLWQAHYNLGLALRQTGDVQQAAASLYRTAELQPQFALTYASMGGLLVDTQNWSKAETYLQRAIDLDPGLAIAHYNLGLIHRHYDRPNAAIVAWETAYRLMPEFTENSIQLVEGYIETDRLPLAKKLIDEILQNDATVVTAHYLSAQISDRRGDPDAALASLRRATELDPSYANAYFGAAQILIANQRTAAAKPLLDYAQTLYRQQGHTDWLKAVEKLQQQIQ